MPISLIPVALAASLVALVSLAPTNGSAPTPTPPREYRTLALPKGPLKYTLLLPDHYDPTHIYPVAIALPPGQQDESMVEAGLARYWEAEAKSRGWVIVSPVAPAWAKVFDASPGPIAALMDEIAFSVHVEGHQFHLVGVSNGGRAAFIGALQAPTHVASIIVLPGLLADTVTPAKLKPLAGIPVAMFAGENDAAWVEGGKKSQKRLQDAGVTVSFEVVPGAGHVMDIPPKQLFDLLDTHRPKPAPAK